MTLIGTALAANAQSHSVTFMNGTWQGDGQQILLDTSRFQANDDASKPFQRDALLIHDITGEMVVFSIGNRQYIGLFKRDKLSLTGGGFPGSIVLHRKR